MIVCSSLSFLVMAKFKGTDFSRVGSYLVLGSVIISSVSRKKCISSTRLSTAFVAGFRWKYVDHPAYPK